MRRKTVDRYLLNNLLDYNYLESIKEQETLIILLIKVSLVCLKIKFRTRCTNHRNWKAIPCDNKYNNKSGPDWKLSSPCPSYGRPERPAMSTGNWIRPMGTNKWPGLSFKHNLTSIIFKLEKSWFLSLNFVKKQNILL